MPRVSSSNQAVFRLAEVVDTFVDADGWLDAGERVALTNVAAEVRSRPVLDVGVGSGRTVPLLRLLTDAYTGIDYSPEMVALCRRLHPDVDIREADARDLGDFADSEMGLVFFSNNGLDAVDHDDRRLFYQEARRVLAPGGALIVSSLNKDGRSYGETPLQLHRPGTSPDLGKRTVAKWAYRNASDPTRIVRRIRNWLATRKAALDEEGWGLAPLSAHDFLLLIHFVTAGELRRELAHAGFEMAAVYDSDTGAAIPDGEHSGADYFYAVARRPTA